MNLRNDYNADLPSSDEVKQLRISYIKANLKRLGDTWRNNKQNLQNAQIHDLSDIDLRIKDLINALERGLK